MEQNLEPIRSKIYEIRGQRVMLDRDLAALYGVTTGNLNKAVKRNIRRFPPDFMFQLTKEEWDSLRFQIGILEVGRGQYTKFLPHAFTEQGLAMLSGILNSDIAIDVNITIMRAFVSLRQVGAIVKQSDLKEMQKEILAYIDDVLADQNDINESTRAQPRTSAAPTFSGCSQQRASPQPLSKLCSTSFILLQCEYFIYIG